MRATRVRFDQRLAPWISSRLRTLCVLGAVVTGGACAELQTVVSLTPANESVRHGRYAQFVSERRERAEFAIGTRWTDRLRSPGSAVVHVCEDEQGAHVGDTVATFKNHRVRREVVAHMQELGDAYAKVLESDGGGHAPVVFFNCHVVRVDRVARREWERRPGWQLVGGPLRVPPSSSENTSKSAEMLSTVRPGLEFYRWESRAEAWFFEIRARARDHGGDWQFELEQCRDGAEVQISVRGPQEVWTLDDLRRLAGSFHVDWATVDRVLLDKYGPNVELPRCASAFLSFYNVLGYLKHGRYPRGAGKVPWFNDELLVGG